MPSPESSEVRAGSSELVVVGAMISVLVILFAPIPPGLLDFLLVVNISFALLILMLTFYMDKPLGFSTFPSILLMATLFRLSLNVAATRLILGQGYAGEVIGAIGAFVVSGNYVVGLVVFTILIVVQYVVVTNGAQRVAEVAARFTLDAMPGKQMSIDADLNMGLITEDEARERRRQIEREANFYGAMDGASKFVKGDAIAGIIIILINIIGGLTIGMVQRGMAWSDALQTYALLTVGDGIVTQIPALVIATGTGIIVTRAATDAHLSREVLQQVSSHPRTLILVAAALGVVMLLPGVPVLPVLVALSLLSLGAFVVMRRQATAEGTSGQSAKTAGPRDLYAEMTVDPVRIDVESGLESLFVGDQTPFQLRLATFRRQFALEMGFVLPGVRIKEDARRAPMTYSITFFGARVGGGTIYPGRQLAINPGGARGALEGMDDRDPAFGLPARWIVTEHVQRARDLGYTVVDPTTVLVTHFSEIVRNQSNLLMSRAETEKLLNRTRETQPTLVEEIVPKLLSIGDIQKVLQGLLRERVPIRGFDLILEALADAGRVTKDTDQLQEAVRQRLGGHIVQQLTSKDGTLHVLTLEPGLDRMLRESLRGADLATGGLVDPGTLDRLVTNLRRNVEMMLTSGLTPVLICAPALRRQLRRWVEMAVPHAAVVSSAEIPAAASVRSFATIAV